jgi:hypothetical protein
MDRRFGIWTRFVLLLIGLAMPGCRPESPPEQGIALPKTQPVCRAWPGGGRDAVQLLTRHYRIYTTATDPDLRRILPAMMEAAHEQYRTLTGLERLDPPDTLAMYMMADRRQWAQLTRGKFGRYAGSYLLVEYGGYTHEGVAVCWDIGGLATYGVAMHEGLHQFLWCRLKQRLPAWFEEGLAACCEGFDLADGRLVLQPFRNLLRQATLRETILQGRWRPLEQLLPATPGQAVSGGAHDAADYYSQVWALQCFLQDDDARRAGLHRMIADAAAGRLRLPDHAGRLRGVAYNSAVSVPLFTTYISEDLTGMNAAWRAHARRLAGLE